jgi:hypothetical protein
MTPNEKNLEKLIKKIIKQQRVDSAELLSQWRGLGARGDRTVIRSLNRQNGWEAFVFWSESEPEVRLMVERISNRAGISEAGVLALKAAGLATGDDTDRSQSLWVLQVVRQGPNENWKDAASLMTGSSDFFEGTLDLLEMEETPSTAEFLTNLLEVKISRDQDQRIRKALYRLRQKGFVAPEKDAKPRFSVAPERLEIFLLAENRLPLWQPFFYYASSGARGDWFFCEITEGKKFEIVQQQRNINMNQKQMQRIADNYASHFEQGTGVKMRFHAASPGHARYFVKSSFGFLEGTDDFRSYMGPGEAEDPIAAWDLNPDLQASEAAALLQLEYFILWMVEDEFLKEFVSRLKIIESGPIILPEQQQRQQKGEAFDRALEDYFAGQTRRIWALALEKAAYSLRESDPENARISAGFARMFADEQIKIASIPLAAALLDRSVQIYERQQAKRETEEKKTSLIMSPDEFQRSLKKS